MEGRVEVGRAAVMGGGDIWCDDPFQSKIFILYFS